MNYIPAFPSMILYGLVLFAAGPVSNLFVLNSVLAENPYPHIHSSYTERVTNRRFIRHIMFEYSESGNMITILATHGPNYHAFHSDLHPLKHPCGAPNQCMETIRELNEFLNTGYNIRLHLQGSTITAIEYLDP